MKRITSLALSAALLASLSTPVLAAPAISVDAAPTAAVLEEENSLWELPQADTPDMSNTVWSFAGGYIDGGSVGVIFDYNGEELRYACIFTWTDEGELLMVAISDVEGADGIYFVR